MPERLKTRGPCQSETIMPKKIGRSKSFMKRLESSQTENSDGYSPTFLIRNQLYMATVSILNEIGAEMLQIVPK